MGIKYFNLVDGSLEFHENKIVIFDKASRNRISLILITISFLFYSSVMTFKGYKKNDNDLLWFGIIMTILWVLVSFFRRAEFQKVQNEILLSSIDQVKFSVDRINGNMIGKIIFQSGQQRKIQLVREDNQDLDFKNLLIDHKIKIE
jgi:hypothetical protein